MTGDLYERLGSSYPQARRADPRIGDLLASAIGDARSVLNVGAGTGSYEPSGCYVIAVEPAPAMRARRPAGAAPCVASSAEALPFGDASVDVAMGVYTDFHWSDRERGIAEMRRVARRAVVLLTVDSATADSYWLIRDYFPEGKELFAPVADLLSMLPGADVRPVMIPDDCQDGFVQAFWKRPHALLDPEVRSSMALFDRLPGDEVKAGLERLSADLEDGTWQQRNRRLLGASSADLGHRIVVWTRRG
ncbi:MAG: class I SAM-dependent methyltransferase [Solirubrobacteraceae bacterium]